MLKKLRPLGGRGYLVAVRHTGQFLIQAKVLSSATSGQSGSYQAQQVDSIYTVYIHINGGYIENTATPLEPPVKKGDCVRKGETVLGYIMNPGGGSHLHFEVRIPGMQPSNNWSMIFDVNNDGSNWATYCKGCSVTGYYYNLQKMIDVGLRDPLDFVNRNSTTTTNFFDGHLDDPTCQEIRGWAMDSNNPENKVTVEIRSDGVVIANTLADKPRPDLESAGIGSHAFSFPMPASLKDGLSHVLAAKVVGGEDLKMSGRVFRNNCGLAPKAVIVVSGGGSTIGNDGTLTVVTAAGTTTPIFFNGSNSDPGQVGGADNFPWILQPTTSPQMAHNNIALASSPPIQNPFPSFETSLSPGVYEVSLTATNTGNLADTARATVIVNSSDANPPL